jgi:hypothetical protein
MAKCDIGWTQIPPSVGATRMRSGAIAQWIAQKIEAKTPVRSRLARCVDTCCEMPLAQQEFHEIA